MKPEVQAIEEVEACPIQEKLPIGLIARAEKDGGREDPLEAFHDAVVSFSVFEEAEEVEHLGRGAETDAPASLAQRQGGHPDGNETVLAEGQAELRMPRDLEEELAVASRVEQLTFGRPAKWKPTKDEWARVEGQVLGSLLPLACNFDVEHRLRGNSGLLQTWVRRVRNRPSWLCPTTASWNSTPWRAPSHGLRT